MYFSKFLKITLSALLVCVAWFENSVASKPEHTATLKILPDRCGYSEPSEFCEAKLTLRWVTNRFSNYCLYAKSTDKSQKITLVKCWENRSKARLDMDFKSAVSVYYVLKAGEKILAETKVTVAKVTRRLNRRRPWRLF